MNNQTVLISGGTRGIGKGSVLQLLEDGFNVVTFSRNDDNINALKKELKEKNFPKKQFLILKADVQKEKTIALVVEKTSERFGTIDVLINNAGIGYFSDCDKADIMLFQEMLQTNIVGIALLTKFVVPHMKKQRSGLIINLASISGKIAFANGEFYSATKFGVMGYSEGIRSELKNFGIKVSTLCPGMIKTDFFDQKELKRRKKLWKGLIPQMLEVKDIQRIISFICKQSKHCDIQDLTVMPF